MISKFRKEQIEAILADKHVGKIMMEILEEIEEKEVDFLWKESDYTWFEAFFRWMYQESLKKEMEEKIAKRELCQASGCLGNCNQRKDQIMTLEEMIIEASEIDFIVPQPYGKDIANSQLSKPGYSFLVSRCLALALQEINQLEEGLEGMKEWLDFPFTQ